jgi:LCP family protein required for cell wall assembly
MGSCVILDKTHTEAQAVDHRSAEGKLGFEERVFLTFLGGAGLLVWVVLALLVARHQATRAASVVLNPIPAGMPTLVEPPASARTSSSARGMGLLTDPLPTRAATPPAPTYTPTPTPPPTATPIPTSMPSGVSMVPIDGDTEVVALLGLDEDQGAAVWRTDSIILAFVDRKGGRLSLLSVPRDLWVQIPGHAGNRVNTVDALGERTHHPGGGRALLDETLRLNLGVPVHHYVRIDFAGFIRMVDAMGGITVDVPVPLREWFPDPKAPLGRRYFTMPAGARQMDGRTALAYCRSRMTTSDFDRSSRQQQVLVALWQKALTLDALKHVPKLWKEFQDSVSTDLSTKDLLQLAHFAYGLEPGQVRRARLDSKTVRSWTTAGGAQVLLPQVEVVQRVVLDLVSTEVPQSAARAAD